MRERMVDILARATGQTRERIVTDIDRDHILRGQAAVDYGLVDEVIEMRDAPDLAAAIAPDRNVA